MHDKSWKSAFSDEMTKKALDSSEVFQNYIQQEMKKEAFYKSADHVISEIENRVAEEEAVLEKIEAFQNKVASDPVLRKRLKQARNVIEDNPQLAAKVDPDFISGLQLLYLDDEGEYDI